MIISASRRTDIPAYFGSWFIQSVRAGFCDIENPFFAGRKHRVSLERKDVDCFVFWTRNPASLLPYLSELDDRGYPYYFLYTLLDYPSILEPGSPSLDKRISLFRQLSQRTGKTRVIWRYDPVLLSSITDIHFHLGKFRNIADRLSGLTERVIVSFYDHYRKSDSRLNMLRTEGYHFSDGTAREREQLLAGFSAAAADKGMVIQTCAEHTGYQLQGAVQGACIDGDFIRQELGIDIKVRKDPGQRKECRCTQSRDIGTYNTCSTGCLYCYATKNGTGSRDI